jgi:hypothetical protein
VPDEVPWLDFEANEHQRNLANLTAMEAEISQRSDRLRTRILHFAEQFGIPEADFWRDLDANPTGPLAATLAREARRQNIHENAAAAYIESLPLVSDFCKLPSVGRNALYVNSDGQVLSGQQLAGAPRPSKSIDFQWTTAEINFYAAQKYTKAGGGNQDNQFNELERLLRNFQGRTNNGVALIVLVDGAYYDESRLARLQGLVRLQRPFSYVTSVNELHALLEAIANGDE